MSDILLRKDSITSVYASPDRRLIKVMVKLYGAYLRKIHVLCLKGRYFRSHGQRVSGEAFSFLLLPRIDGFGKQEPSVQRKSLRTPETFVLCTSLPCRPYFETRAGFGGLIGFLSLRSRTMMMMKTTGGIQGCGRSAVASALASRRLIPSPSTSAAPCQSFTNLPAPTVSAGGSCSPHRGITFQLYPSFHLFVSVTFNFRSSLRHSTSASIPMQATQNILS